MGVLVPGLRVNREYRPGYNWIQCGFVTEILTAQISTDDKNRNFIIFWCSAFYVSMKPPLHPTLKYVVQPMTKRFHLPFRFWSVVPTWIPSKKDAETHPRIKNQGQTKSGKSAVGWDPLTISNIINRLKPTRAITSILKLGNYGVHCSLRTTILISIITQ